jgi:hypothetical protein
MESKANLSFDKNKEKINNFFNPIINFMAYIWSSFLIMLIGFSFMGSLYLFVNEGYYILVEMGIKIITCFVLIWILIIVFYLIQRLLLYKNKQNKIISEKIDSLIEDFKKEILKDIKKENRNGKRY